MSKRIIFLMSFVICAILMFLCFFADIQKKSVVRVKGLYEKEVVADKAFWNLSFANAGINLETIQEKSKKDLEIIMNFLTSNGLEKNEIKIDLLDLVDFDSREYKDPNQKNKYILTQSVLIETTKVELIEKIAQQIDFLIKKNVSLKSNGYNEGIKPVFAFTKLNDIKEEMIAEAIKNARKSVNQFIVGTNQKVDKIKYADQGTFVFLPKNKSTNNYSNNENFSKEKQVRVVLTMEYWLK